MFDIDRRKDLLNCNVSDLIAELKKLPQDAFICCCGDNRIFIHVEEDNSVVNIDCEGLDDLYDIL